VLKQRTLSNSVRASGVGLHSGEKVNMTLRPAAKDTGIIFRRLDIEPIQQIPALATSVIDTMLGTTIAKKNASVMTVEHILAAFAGLGIDNALIDLDGPEVCYQIFSVLKHLQDQSNQLLPCLRKDQVMHVPLKV